MSAIDLCGLSKTFYDGGVQNKALNNVSFTVNEGEIYGFVGANGAGKSTAMRIIMGVLNADAGEVKLFQEFANTELRRQVGYMPAERGLYGKMKVAEQLVFFAKLRGLSTKEAKEKAEKWIELLDLSEHAKKNLEALSTGNQQRAQIATALVTEPKILVLDEPFSGLDPIAVANLSDMLHKLSKSGTTILFSSHQLELVDKLCDSVGIIQKGEMISSGSPDDLRKFAAEKYGAPLEVTVPTPLSDIFADIVKG